MNDMTELRPQYAKDALSRAPGYVKGRTPERLDSIGFDDELMVLRPSSSESRMSEGRARTAL